MTPGRPRSVYGSIERIPGALFRSMGTFFLRRYGRVSREALAGRLAQRLKEVGVSYHVRTLKRQLSGTIASVPPEVEQAMQELLIQSNGLRTPNQVERALAASGLGVAPSERMTEYVAFDRIRPLVELWLFLNPGRTPRSLACGLRRDLGRDQVRLTVNSLQAILAGQHVLVPRALQETLLDYLVACGVPSEPDAQRRWQTQAEAIGLALERRRFVDPGRFHRLCQLWQLRHREASSRRLALQLQQKVAQRGVSLSLHHYQELVNGRVRRVRRGILDAMEELVREDLPQAEHLGEALAKVSLESAALANLHWVQVQPIAALAREWLKQHPQWSRRQLAIRVANTVRRMGYACSHHTIQSIVARGKHKTRGYVYRALLKQFGDRTRARIPEEHIIRPLWSTAEEGAAMTTRSKKTAYLAFGAMSSKQQSRQPAFTVYVKRAREYLASHDSSQLREFLAARAEHLYGVPRNKVKARLRAQAFGKRLRSDSRHLQTDSRERWQNTEQAVGTPPAVADPEYERLIRQVNADEPVNIT